MGKKKKLDWRHHIATIMGILVAIATGWSTIDWTNFDIVREWPKLVLSAVIAVGGTLSRLTVGEKKGPEDLPPPNLN